MVHLKVNTIYFHVVVYCDASSTVTNFEVLRFFSDSIPRSTLIEVYVGPKRTGLISGINIIKINL
jgi:hypothetical protein